MGFSNFYFDMQHKLLLSRFLLSSEFFVPGDLVQQRSLFRFEKRFPEIPETDVEVATNGPTYGLTFALCHTDTYTVGLRKSLRFVSFCPFKIT